MLTLMLNQSNDKNMKKLFILLAIVAFAAGACKTTTTGSNTDAAKPTTGKYAQDESKTLSNDPNAAKPNITKPTTSKTKEQWAKEKGLDVNKPEKTVAPEE